MRFALISLEVAKVSALISSSEANKTMFDLGSKHFNNEYSFCDLYKLEVINKYLFFSLQIEAAVNKEIPTKSSTTKRPLFAK